MPTAPPRQSIHYRVQTLGEHRVDSADAICELSEYEFALAAYTALAPRRVRREDLCELLWSADGPSERHRLRQLLYNIRCKAPGFLSKECAEVLGGNVEIDAALALEAVRRGDAEFAVMLFRGRFLSEISDISPAFCEWRDAYGAELLQSVGRSVHARLGLMPQEAADEVLLLTAWLSEYAELVALEKVQRVHALLDVGSTVTAAAELHVLEEEPTTRALEFELERLNDRLRLLESSKSREIHLVMSDSAQQSISARIHPSSPIPILLLVGDRGIGKSRWLDWIMRLAAVRGAAVYSHRVIARSGGEPPDGIVRRFLRSFLSDGAPAGRNTLSLQRLLNSATLPGIHQAAAAIADACKDRWSVIAVDNVNHADGPTKQLLQLISAMDQSQSVLIICAVSGELSESDSAWIDAMLPNVDVVHIEPLPLYLSTTLAERAAHAGGFHLTGHQRAIIVEQSGGNPSKLLQMTHAVGASLSTPWPATYADAFVSARTADTLRQLTSAQSQILRILSLAGKPVTQSALCKISAVEHGDILGHLTHLQQVGLANVDGNEIVVSSPIVRETCRASIDHWQRRQMFSELAGYYQAVGDNWTAAGFYEQAGDRRTAGKCHEMAGRTSVSKGAFNAAERELKQALALADNHTELECRNRLLANYYTIVSRWVEATPHLLALNERSPDEDLVLLVGRASSMDAMTSDEWLDFVHSFDELLQSGTEEVTAARAYLIAFDKAYQSGMETIVLPSFRTYLERRSSSDERTLAELCMKSARVNQLFGDPALARGEAEAAVEHAVVTNDPVVISNAFDTRALVSFLNGSVDSAFADFTRSEEVASSSALYFLRERYYNNLAVLCYETGDLDQARRLLRSAALFDQQTQLYAVANLAVVELAARKFELAHSYATRLVTSWSAACTMIGASICGLIALEHNAHAEARQIFTSVHEAIGRSGIQITDPSYTLMFLARIAPHVGFDALPLLIQVAERVRHRNIYSYLRIRLATARLIAAEQPDEGLAILRQVLSNAVRVRAAHTRREAEALLSTLSP